MTNHNRDMIAGRLMLLETTRLECPEMMTPEDWREYRHYKRQYAELSNDKPRERKIRFSAVRKYNDGMVYYDRGEGGG